MREGQAPTPYTAAGLYAMLNPFTPPNLIPMSIRLVSCLIRVDEELLDCDFSASIEESVTAWEGCTVARWNDPDQSQANDSLVLSIADALWGDDADTEWNSDTINAIADAIRNVRPELAKS